MTEEKKMQITFAPGAFDSFEGTQEELDELVKEIQTMFSELTPEELKNRSQPVDITDLIDDETLTDEQFEQILENLVGEQNKKLQ